MAPPGYRILTVKPAPARDTANESQRTLWRMNPELDELFDPACCLEMTDAPKDAPVYPNSVNTPNLPEHIRQVSARWKLGRSPQRLILWALLT
eukprot:3726065-Pleurochrysis_carterae.AAC.1